MTHRLPDSNSDVLPPLSKRAARRIVQRAWVLTGRDRRVRQHLRTLEISTLWILEDWNFSWTVVFHRGRIEFDRHVVKQPDLTLTWPSSAAFFAEVERGLLTSEGFGVEGDLALKKLCEPLFTAFTRTLQALLLDPVDEKGISLV